MHPITPQPSVQHLALVALVALVALLGAVDAATVGPVTFQSNDWYLANVNTNCDTACALVGRTCDGDVLTSYADPGEVAFEALLQGFGISASYLSLIHI